jgi:polyhydroxyalkanoate synthase
MYLFAAQKDHIVPWQSAFKSTKYLNGSLRFVLGASGHTAGVVNPVSTNKRSYWVNNNLNGSAENWFLHATEIAGSWWNDYSTWLEALSGEKVAAPKKAGNTKYPALVAAPGTYVLDKAISLADLAMV